MGRASPLPSLSMIDFPFFDFTFLSSISRAGLLVLYSCNDYFFIVEIFYFMLNTIESFAGFIIPVDSFTILESTRCYSILFLLEGPILKSQ